MAHHSSLQPDTTALGGAAPGGFQCPLNAAVTAAQAASPTGDIVDLYHTSTYSTAGGGPGPSEQTTPMGLGPVPLAADPIPPSAQFTSPGALPQGTPSSSGTQGPPAVSTATAIQVAEALRTLLIGADPDPDTEESDVEGNLAPFRHHGRTPSSAAEP